MSVWLNEKGQYEIQFSQGGRRVHRVLPKGTTRQQAKKAENKLRGEVFRADELGELPDYTIGEGIMRYLREYTGKAKKQTESHAKALKEAVKGKSISRLTEVCDEIRRLRPFKNSAGEGEPRRRITTSTANRRLAILRRVAHLAYRRWGWLKEPLHEKIELLPENPQRHVYLNRSELASLLWKIKNRTYRRACYMAAFTGMRRSELLNLEPDDIRDNVICLTETKTGSPRNIPIVKRARWAFKKLPFRVDNYALSKAVRKASGGEVRFHDLRHTAASLLVNAGVDLYVVGAILGHRSTQTTKRYAHLSIKTLEQAVNKLQTPRQLPANQNTENKDAA
jgi:integrase